MFGLRFIKGQPTNYLLQYRSGKVVREGAAQSLSYYGPTTSPVTARVASSATPFIFQETTGDFQTVTVQGEVARKNVRLDVKTQFEWDLLFTVREPFQTRTTGTSLVFGRVAPSFPLVLESRMAEKGVIFSDGIDKDFMEFNSGTHAAIGVAERKGVLVA